MRTQQAGALHNSGGRKLIDDNAAVSIVEVTYERTQCSTRENNTMKAKLRARVVIDVTGGNQILTTRTNNLRTNTTWNKQARESFRYHHEKSAVTGDTVAEERKRGRKADHLPVEMPRFIIRVPARDSSLEAVAWMQTNLSSRLLSTRHLDSQESKCLESKGRFADVIFCWELDNIFAVTKPNVSQLLGQDRVVKSAEYHPRTSSNLCSPRKRLQVHRK